MSVLRQANFLGQQRLDVPHLRALESSIVADFDVLAGRVMSGSKAVVVRGFTLTNTASGTTANAIQLSTADSILFNINATEAGTFLWVPSNRTAETLNSATNARVDGSFTANQVNYVGLDLVRRADDSTTDLVQFLDANTLLETAKNVPLARTLDYRIVISTTPFSAQPNIVPIARITTDALNQVSSAAGAVEDARNMMYRLGAGGDFPNRYASFSWPTGRVEQDPAIVALQNLSRFSGGDKDIRSQKDWMDAVMTRLWEVGGGQNWYSPVADRNLKLVGNPSPSVFTSTGDNFEWGIEAGVPATGLYSVNHLHWQGLRVLFENANVSGVYYNIISDQLSDDPGTPANSTGSKTALAVGDCIYVDIDRTSNATVVAKKAALQTLGSPTIPGSRVILAWRTADGVFRRDSQNAVNTSFPVATTGAPGAVRLAYAAGHPTAPTVTPLNADNGIVIGDTPYLVTSGTYALEVYGADGGVTAAIFRAGIDGIGVTGFGDGIGQGGFFRGGNGADTWGVYGLSNGTGNTRGGVFAASASTGWGILAQGGARGGTFEATAAGGIGIVATGNTTGAGVDATGGASNGTGVIGRGGNSNGAGVIGYGKGTGSGVNGYTDAANVSVGVAAINGIAQGANHRGVWGVGTGSQPAVYGEPATGGTGHGGHFVGGDAGGDGVYGISNHSSGVGVRGTGKALTASVGGYFQGGTGGGGVSGEGIIAIGGSPSIGTGKPGITATGGSNREGGSFAAGTGGSPGIITTGGSTGGPGIRAQNGLNTTDSAIDCRGSIDFSNATSPASTVPLAQRMTRDLFNKAWILFTCNNTTSPDIIDGQNVTSVSQSTGGGTDGNITITLATAFTTAGTPAYAVTGKFGCTAQDMTTSGGAPPTMQVVAKSANTVEVNFLAPATGTVRTAATSNGKTYLVIFWGIS